MKERHLAGNIFQGEASLYFLGSYAKYGGSKPRPKAAGQNAFTFQLMMLIEDQRG